MNNTYIPAEGIAKAPEGAECGYWGRWIYPDDIVPDRHQIIGDPDTDATQKFAAWLDGSPHTFGMVIGDGSVRLPIGTVDRHSALGAAKAEARRLANGHTETRVDKLTGDIIHTLREMRGTDTKQYVLYEDDYGILVGCPNKSYGYVYVVGWRKEDM